MPATRSAWSGSAWEGRSCSTWPYRKAARWRPRWPSTPSASSPTTTPGCRPTCSSTTRTRTPSSRSDRPTSWPATITAGDRPHARDRPLSGRPRLPQRREPARHLRPRAGREGVGARDQLPARAPRVTTAGQNRARRDPARSGPAVSRARQCQRPWVPSRSSGRPNVSERLAGVEGVVEGPSRHHPAVSQQQDVAEPDRDLLDVVGDHHRRRGWPGPRPTGPGGHQPLPAADVEAGGRLVEQQQGRVRSSGPGQEDLLSFAVGKHAEGPVGDRLEARSRPAVARARSLSLSS